MKMMVSPRNFQGNIVRAGEPMSYSTTNFSKPLLQQNRKLSLKHPSRQTNSTIGEAIVSKKFDNMKSLFNRSSQYDKNASTTLDGTQVSVQNYDISLRTDVDPID